MDHTTIAGHSFNEARKGWKQDEVRAYLVEVAQEVSSLAAENDLLRVEIVRLETQLTASQDVERRLSAALQGVNAATELLAGQNAAVSQPESRVILARARAEAEAVVREAERRSERLLQQANARLDTLRDQIEQLHARRTALVGRFKAVLRAQMDFVAALEADERPGAVRNPLGSARSTREGVGADDLAFIIDTLDREDSQA
jgi:cell division septum initiation protein DivIVA